ncbi:MAG: hypothetical protein ACUVSY_12150 [Roseiflexus sp.]
MAQREPTIASILMELAEEYDDVVAEHEIYERVLHRRPSRARDPFASIRERLRFEANEVGWVRLGEGKLLPLRVALTGLRFRVAPDPHEMVTGLLLRTRLLPFVPLNYADFILVDGDGAPISFQLDTIIRVDDLFGPMEQPAINIGEWMHREGMFDGDTILVTIEQASPLTLRFQREPYPAVWSIEARRQEQELLEGIVARVMSSRSLPISAAEAVLPVYARAPWRTTYIGRPWQELVMHDHRLRLINEMFLSNRMHHSLTAISDNREQQNTWEVRDAQLLAAIDALQREMLESRREAATQEIWNGIAPRASTARVVFDTRTGETTVVQPDPINTLQDHVDRIEERLRNGEYDQSDWELDEDDALFADAGIDDDDLLIIDDLREFITQHPELLAAARRLLAALGPDEIERLHRAQSNEEVQNILAARFHRMLPDNPHLFATLVPYVAPDTTISDFNGGPPELEEVADDDISLLDQDWDDDNDAWDDEINDQSTLSDEALAASHELMERFYAFLLAQGKSEATAASRTGDLWIYADFLASYYAQTLAEGNYATLDECLFFFYPRRVANSSPRGARELCTSLKQFYAFLRAESNIDDRFAREMWRRRDQAARVVDLYERIDADSPQFERLFVHLFAPYTV